MTPILITGGAGYFGSHAVLAFREEGYGVVVLDELSSGRREAVPESITDPLKYNRTNASFGPIRHPAGPLPAHAKSALPPGFAAR